MTAAPRPAARRIADTLATLEQRGADAWVATASPAGTAHLVPLSYAWDGQHVVIAAQPASPTMRNIVASGRARLGFGPTRDVTIVDATLDELMDAREADPALVEGYVRQAGWDPRAEPEPYAIVLLRPQRIQAWREANELAGRTLMRDGAWLVEAGER